MHRGRATAGPLQSAGTHHAGSVRLLPYPILSELAIIAIITAVSHRESFAHSKLYILDARGKIAATLNMAVGKGTEGPSHLP